MADEKNKQKPFELGVSGPNPSAVSLTVNYIKNGSPQKNKDVIFFTGQKDHLRRSILNDAADNPVIMRTNDLARIEANFDLSAQVAAGATHITAQASDGGVDSKVIPGVEVEDIIKPTSSPTEWLTPTGQTIHGDPQNYEATVKAGSEITIVSNTPINVYQPDTRRFALDSTGTRMKGKKRYKVMADGDGRWSGDVELAGGDLQADLTITRLDKNLRVEKTQVFA